MFSSGNGLENPFGNNGGAQIKGGDAMAGPEMIHNMIEMLLSPNNETRKQAEETLANMRKA